MKRFNITLIYVFSLFLFSCEIEKEIDLSHLTSTPGLVLNAVIHSEKKINEIFYSQTFTLFDTIYSRPAVDEGDYYKKQELLYKASLIPDVNSSVYINGQLSSNVFPDMKDSITYLKDLIKPGDRVEIKAWHKEREISSSFIMPDKPEITAIDTSAFFLKKYQGHILNVWNKDMLRVWVTLQDKPGIKNYYRIFIDIESEEHIDPEFAAENNIPEIIYTYESGVESEDIVITQGNPKNDSSDFDLTEFEQNIFNIFTDDLFNGQEYKLDVFTLLYPDLPHIYEFPDESWVWINEHIILRKVTHTLRIQSITEDYYNYLSTLSKATQLSWEFIEPVKVYNNIDGGCGIFGAVNEIKIKVLEQEIKPEKFPYPWY